MEKSHTCYPGNGFAFFRSGGVIFLTEFQKSFTGDCFSFAFWYGREYIRVTLQKTDEAKTALMRESYETKFRRT